MTTEFEDPIEKWEEYVYLCKHVPKGQRQGQWAINALSQVGRDDLVDLLVNEASHIDPYNNDNNLPAFTEWLENHWLDSFQ